MAKSPYFIHYTYEGFSNIEDGLMSLIVGLNKSKQHICFSNGYAAVMLKCSKRTITTSLSKFVDLGYVECVFTQSGRIINLLEEPNKFIYQEECDIIPPIETISTPIEIISTPIETISTPIEIISTNSRVDKIEDKIEDSRVEQQTQHYSTDFLSLLEIYEEDGNDLDPCYYLWEKLSPQEKNDAIGKVKFYFLYLQSKKNFYKKSLYYYIKDKVWNWTSLKQIQDKHQKQEHKNKTSQEIHKRRMADLGLN